MDQSLDFTNEASSDASVKEIKNQEAYNLLRKSGVDVYFDEPARFTHAKAVIISTR